MLSVQSADDLTWLQNTLQDFAKRTGSKIAETLLSDWPASAKDFLKVLFRYISWIFTVDMF